MLVSVLVQVPFAIFPLLNIPAPTRDCQLEVLQPAAIEERALAEFDSRVAAYVVLQRRLARSLYPMPPFDEEGFFDDEAVLSDGLREVMVAARPLAQQADFFTPRVAELFRERIDRALAVGVSGRPVPLYEPLPGEPAPAVNSAFPFVMGVVQWPELVRALPALPRELTYALWGRDLVLVDVAANLVLDILPDALPEGARPGVSYQ
jgi:hypothetical protein